MLATIPISPLPNAVVSEGCKSTSEPGQGESDFLSTFAAVADQKRNMDDAADGTNVHKAGWNGKGKPSNEVKSKDSSESDALESEKPEETAKDSEEETESVTPAPLEDDSQQTSTTDFAIGIADGQQMDPDAATSENPGDEPDSSKFPDGSSGSNDQNPVIKKVDETLPLSGKEIEGSESAGLKPESSGIEKVVSEGKEPGGIMDTASTVTENGETVPEEAKSASSETGMRTGETATGESTGEAVVNAVSASSPPNGTGQEGEGKPVGSAVRESENGSVNTSNAGTSDGEGEIKSGNTEAEAARRGINRPDGLAAEAPSETKSSADMGKEKADRMFFRDVNSNWTERSKKGDTFSDGKGIAKAADGSNGLERKIFQLKSSNGSAKLSQKSSDSMGKDSAETTLVFRGSRKVDILSAQKQGSLNEDMNAKIFAERSTDATANVSVSKDDVLASNLRSVSEDISSEAKNAEKNAGTQKESSAKTGETSGKVIDIRNAEAQSRKSGSENQNSQSDDKKQHHSQGKEFHGVLEKSEAVKGEDTPLVSRAKYGTDNGTNTVFQETEKETQKSSGGKESLGSLVRSAAFLLKNGRSQVKMALYPESLGHLKISISTESHQVTVKIMTETMAAKDLIENNLQQLKVDFQNQGLEIQKFDVSLSQDSNRNGAGHNPSLENRTRGKSGTKKDEKTGQDETLEQAVSNFSRTGHNNAVDFFA